MKVLVTGGAGFIGSHLVEKLVESTAEVIVYDNLTTGCLRNLERLLPDIKFIEGDIRDRDRLSSAMAGVDIVFHLAARTSVAESIQDPWTTYEVNNNGTLNVLIGALQADVQRVVLTSSCAVYGDAHEPPLKESYPVSPKSLYGATKVNLEAMAESFYHSHQLEYVALRLFNVYGPRQKSDSDYAAVIPKFIKCYQMKKPPTIYGDGLQTRDFIWVGDVVKGLANVLALNSEILRKNRVFNLGTGKPMSVVQLLYIISSIAGYEMKPIYQQSRVGEVKHSFADIMLLTEYQLLDKTLDVRDGIEEIWLKEMGLHKNWYKFVL